MVRFIFDNFNQRVGQIFMVPRSYNDLFPSLLYVWLIRRNNLRKHFSLSSHCHLSIGHFNDSNISHGKSYNNTTKTTNEVLQIIQCGTSTFNTKLGQELETTLYVKFISNNVEVFNLSIYCGNCWFYALVKGVEFFKTPSFSCLLNFHKRFYITHAQPLIHQNTIFALSIWFHQEISAIVS